MKRVFLVLLTMLLIGNGCSFQPVNSGPETIHTDLSFSALTESGIDASLEVARAKELLFRIEHGELSGIRAQEALDARADALDRLKTDAAIAYVRYCLDVTDGARKEAYDVLLYKTDTLDCLLTDAAILLSDDPSLSERYDPAEKERLKRKNTLSDPSILPLLERERVLTERYETLSQELTVTAFGRKWTGDEIVSDATLPYDVFSELYEQYMQLFNREAGTIFLELIAVRKETAAALGYSNYVDYAYARFDRDYTPSEAADLSERIRRAFVPLLIEAQTAFFSNAGALYGAVFEQEPTMDRIGKAIASIFPELFAPWTYMLSHEMYDLGTDTKRMPGNFTTYFSAYGAPFLFGSWTNGFETPSAIIHEFGHYAGCFLNTAATVNGNSIDLAEIDAEGLELLTVLRYDTIYGVLSGAAENALLFYALYALIDGCLEDAFQRFAYETTDLSVERLNDEYARLLKDYGLEALGIDPRSWTQIPHTFQSPFYYVSYATSMLAALELYLESKTDVGAAKTAYLRILMRNGDSRFRETLPAAGLKDPFETGTVENTAYELGSVRRNRKNE